MSKGVCGMDTLIFLNLQIMLSCKDQKIFAYQCLENVTLYKYANFYQNIPCSFRVMNIFTKRPRQAKMKLGKTSPQFCIPVAG